MRAKISQYLQTLFHGVTEILAVLPALLLLSVLSLNQQEIPVWFIYIVVLFFVSCIMRDWLMSQNRFLPYGIIILCAGVSSWFVFDTMVGKVFAIITAFFIVYRGIQHAEKPWQVLLPSRIFWMIGVPAYIAGYLFFLFNENLNTYTSWISTAGFLFMIVMVFITNQQKLQQASYVKDGQEKVSSGVQHFNQFYLGITLLVVVLIANLQEIQTTIGYALRSVVNTILGDSGATLDSGEGAEPPDMEPPSIEIGDGSREITMPEWLDQVLFIAGIVIIVAMIITVLAVFFKKFRSGLKHMFTWFIHLFSNKGSAEHRDTRQTKYEDEKENLFDWKKWRHGMKDKYKDVFQKITKRKTNIETLSLEEKIRYIYKYLAAEVKAQEKWRASLTAREVLQLNEKHANLDQFKQWYDDIRYTNQSSEAIPAETVNQFWEALQERE